MLQHADPGAGLEAQRQAFRKWLSENRGALECLRSEPRGDLEQAFAQTRPVQRMLFEAGWTRLGWPVEVGGLGGSPLVRAALLDELSAAGYAVPELLGTLEIIAPMLVRFAPELAREHLAAALAGDEIWCQGFSEPEAGSDLGSLRTRAAEVEGGFRLDGQKMWSSDGHLARRCCVLARTGPPDSGYRGLSMFWVDLDSPGVRVRPTPCASGRAEVAEIFFDGVFVPDARLVGRVGEGWKVVMFLLQYERGAYGWYRQGELHHQLQALIESAEEPSPELVGESYVAILALRAQCLRSLEALASGRDLGPEISVDKLLMGQAEQTLTDAARALLWPALELEDTPSAEFWRRRWSFARITTIYGGTAEVQKDLVAERLLGLPRVR